MSVRRRLVLLCSLAVAGAIALAAVGAYLAVRSELLGQVDEAMERQADVISQLSREGVLTRREIAKQPLPSSGALPFAAQELSVELLKPNGNVSSFPAPTSPVDARTSDEAIAGAGTGRAVDDRQVDGETYRVLTQGIGSQGAVIISRSLSGTGNVLARLRLILGLLAVTGTFAAAGLALLVARRVTAPIRRISLVADEIGGTRDLSRRIPVSGEDEVAGLATRFNMMLVALEENQDALSSSVFAQRQLVADASHELRTPVSAVRTDIETLLVHPDLEPVKRAHILIEADRRIEELTELISDIIELARGDGPKGEAEELRLDELVESCLERQRDLTPDRRLRLEASPTVVWGQPDRIARAINNLLDNAHKYSPADQPIEVSVSRGSVRIRDHGPGISAADLPFIFDRFWRGSGSRSEQGSGLGLAIVRQVADSHGCEVDVRRAEDGGAVFSLLFEDLPIEMTGDRPASVADCTEGPRARAD